MNQDTINIIFTAIVIPLLSTLTVYVVTFIKAKTAELKSKTENDTLDRYIDIAEDAIETAVVSVTQTYVEALKKENKFDAAAQSKALAMARNNAISIMGDTAKKALEQAYGDVNSWIDNNLEYYVNVSK